jgi:hypothetical protein
MAQKIGETVINADDLSAKGLAKGAALTAIDTALIHGK